MSIKGQGHFLILVKGHSDFKVKTWFSQKQLGDLEPKLIWKLKGEWEWKFIQMSLVTWPTWLPCPYMEKKFKKSSSPEPTDRWSWKSICSIVYASATKVVQIMTLVWPWPILGQGQIWSHTLLYGKKWKLFFLKLLQFWSQRCLKHSTKWVNEVEWVSKVKFILWPRSKITQISKLKVIFLRNSWVICNQSSYESLWKNGNENFYKWVGSHDQDGCRAHIWKKDFKNLLL